MFHAVRKWWESGRGKVTTRLFLFEILVVTLGVLLAQGLQQEIQSRDDHRHMEQERGRARQELATAHMMFLAWQAAVPCLDDRMTEIMAGKLQDGASLRRPSFPFPSYAEPDDQSLLLMGKVYGLDERDLYRGLTSSIQGLEQRGDRIIDAWGRFALLDPANGRADQSDRAEVRRAAADIKAQLRSLAIGTRIAIMRLERMGVPAFNREQPNNGPAKSCEAIWNSGRLDPPISTR
jgi:hypothetical protein